jgi:hypothetical protein
MRTHFDQLAKQLAKAALRGKGIVSVHDEISPEPQHADLRFEPDPRRQAERKRLGLLGQITSGLCLIEIYSHALNAEEFLACIGKHIAFWHQRGRETRVDNKRRQKRGLPPRKLVKPSVWIISAGTPSALRTKLAFQKAPGGPDGVYYFFFDVFRVGLIVAPELPRDPSTLLVRLMAAGPLLPEAIRELRKLPPTAPERVVAEEILVRFQRFLRKKANRTTQEQEFIKAMYKTWEDARAEGIAKGIAKGRAEGSTETQAKAVLTVLQVRGIPVSAAARKRILGEKDRKQLERWLKKASVATSLDEVFSTRS